MSQNTEVLYVMKKKGLIPIILVLIPLMLNWGCDGTGGGNGPDTTSNYYLVGGLVKNLDLDQVQTVAYMEKDDSLASLSDFIRSLRATIDELD